MARSFRRWRPTQLLLAWVAYWLGLGVVTLGPAVPAILRATGSDAKGSLTASYGDQGVSLTVTADGATAWSGTASLTAIVLWVVGPPLLLWLVWFVRRRPRDEQLAAPNVNVLSEGEAQLLDVGRQRARSERSD